MSDTLACLYRLQKRDIQRAALTLADAFQHDPTRSAIWGDATMTQRAYAFESPIRYCLRYGHVYAPSEAIEGVAAWLPGEMAEMSFLRVLLSGVLWPVMKFPGIISIMKAQPIFRPLELDRKAYISEKPFIYLQIIGVATAYQGQGYGGLLLRGLIESSEKAGISLYLETETKANVSLYERYGFSVIKEVILAKVNLPMWEMAREV